MNKPYRDIRLRQGSPEWLEFRKSGIGGSEIASVMATDSKELAELVYVPPLKLFLEKIGEPIQQFTGNVATFEGKLQEKAIINRFKYYDLERPDPLIMHKNMEEGFVINQVRKNNGVFQNPKYDWLYLSPDSLYIKDGKRAGLLEAKLTTSMTTKTFENKINPSHYLQVMQGLMITRLPVGYILLLIDGQWFEVVRVEPDEKVFEWIETISAQFWMNVLRARKIKVEYDIDAYFQVNPDSLTPKQREGAALLAELEPSMIGSEREVAFIKAMIVPQVEEVSREGTQEEFESAMAYLQVGESLTEFERLKKVYYAEMIRSLNGHNVIKFMDGKSGYYSFKPDKNGKVSLYCSTKIRR